MLCYLICFVYGWLIDRRYRGVCVFLLGIPSSWRVMPGEEAAYDGEGYPEDNQDEVLEPWFTWIIWTSSLFLFSLSFYLLVWQCFVTL